MCRKAHAVWASLFDRKSLFEAYQIIPDRVSITRLQFTTFITSSEKALSLPDELKAVAEK
jgi:hypothetical protein